MLGNGAKMYDWGEPPLKRPRLPMEYFNKKGYMKELRNTELFGDGKLIGYRTDDGIMYITPHYKKDRMEYIRIETMGSGNHAIISTDRLDEVLKILLTIRKDLHRGRV